MTKTSKNNDTKEPMGPEQLARRRAVVILEVLAGFRSAPEAAEELAVSQQTYYLVEKRALKGLVKGCELSYLPEFLPLIGLKRVDEPLLS